MKMYKEECARLWYYVDQQLSSKHTYLIFLNDVKNRLEAQLYTDFAEPDKEVVISDDDEVRVSIFFCLTILSISRDLCEIASIWFLKHNKEADLRSHQKL